MAGQRRGNARRPARCTNRPIASVGAPASAGLGLGIFALESLKYLSLELIESSKALNSLRGLFFDHLGCIRPKHWDYQRTFERLREIPGNLRRRPRRSTACTRGKVSTFGGC